jgi:hypothetical protein
VRHHRGGCWTLLAGFRWVELGEELNGVYDNQGAIARYGIDVDNHLYGVQVGAEVDLWRIGPVCFDSWVKTGVFARESDSDVGVDLRGILAGTDSITSADSGTSFLGEIGIGMKYEIFCWLAARAGYQAMWITDVALAPEQFDAADPSVGLAGIDTSGSVFYHGGFVGLEALW